MVDLLDPSASIKRAGKMDSLIKHQFIHVIYSAMNESFNNQRIGRRRWKMELFKLNAEVSGVRIMRCIMNRVKVNKFPVREQELEEL